MSYFISLLQLENGGSPRKRPSIGTTAHNSSLIHLDDDDDALRIEEVPLLIDDTESTEICDIQETVEMVVTVHLYH